MLHILTLPYLTPHCHFAQLVVAKVVAVLALCLAQLVVAMVRAVIIIEVKSEQEEVELAGRIRSLADSMWADRINKRRRLQQQQQQQETAAAAGDSSSSEVDSAETPAAAAATASMAGPPQPRLCAEYLNTGNCARGLTCTEAHLPRMPPVKPAMPVPVLEPDHEQWRFEPLLETVEQPLSPRSSDTEDIYMRQAETMEAEAMAMPEAVRSVREPPTRVDIVYVLLFTYIHIYIYIYIYKRPT